MVDPNFSLRGGNTNEETKAANSSRQLTEYKSLKSTATIRSDQLG